MPIRAVALTQDNAIRIINPVSGRFLKSALVNPSKPPLNDLVYIPQIETIYVLKTPADEPNSLEIQIFDGTQNPCRVKETWNENKWDAAITAIALFDYYANFVLSEKGITFTASMDIKCFIQTYKTCCYNFHFRETTRNLGTNNFSYCWDEGWISCKNRFGNWTY